MTSDRSPLALLFTLLVAPLLAVLHGGSAPAQATAPSWEELSRRTPPAWFQDARFGIFIHWGAYSVPAICDTSTYSEWYQHWLDTNSHGGLVRQFHERVYGADAEYRDFAPAFRAELFDPDEWARIFERAGARYIVITSKHHDGFCLWPSAVASEVRGYPWNAGETGPKRDLLGDLATAVRKRGLKFGLYYSFMEWHNPVFDRSIPEYVERVMFPQVKDLMARYEPAIFWPDGEWNHPDTTWRARELLDWLYGNVKNPDEFVVNDRWGKGLRGRVGDFYTTEYGDGGNGGDSYSGARPFEECRGIGHSFAFNRLEDYDVYLSRTAAVRTLIDMVSRGGNLLLDIGPKADGTIPLIMVDRLFAIGDWLEVNGEAIHGTTKSPFRQTPWGRATQKGNTVYLHVYSWPESGQLVVPLQNDPVAARVLGGGQVPARQQDDRGLVIDLFDARQGEHATVVAVELDGPPVEDGRFLPDGDGVITLPVTLAELQGDTIKLEKHVDRKQSATLQNVGHWSRPGDSVVWQNVSIDTELTPMLIEIEFAVAPGAAGGTLEWRAGRNRGRYEIGDDTGGWQSYRRAVIGGFNYRGAATVRLSCKAVTGAGLCNLRAVRLIPDRAGKVVAAAMATPAHREVAQLLLGMATALEEGRHGDVAAVYADHGWLAGPGGYRVEGREAIDAYWAGLGEAKRWQLDVRSAEGRGGIVVQRGRSTLLRDRDGRERTSIVEFVLTWQRQDDGAWRILSDVYWPAR